VTVTAPDGYVVYGSYKDGSSRIMGIANYRSDGGFLTFRNGQQVGSKIDLKTSLILSQIKATLNK